MFSGGHRKRQKVTESRLIEVDPSCHESKVGTVHSVTSGPQNSVYSNESKIRKSEKMPQINHLVEKSKPKIV